MSWMDAISGALLLLGALSCLMGAIGVITFPDVAARLQAATKPQTLGLLLVLAGAALRLPLQDAASLVVVALFQLLTSPVLAQLVGRSAYRSGSVRHETLVIDELGERIDQEQQE